MEDLALSTGSHMGSQNNIALHGNSQSSAFLVGVCSKASQFLSGIVGVIFGGVTLVLGIRQCMFGSYSTAATFFLFAAIFLIGNPLHLKARAAEQVMRSPMFQKPISYELNEEGIRISQDEQSVLNEWGDFRKAVSTGQSVIIYVTKVRALIFPRESMGEQYAAAVQMISTHMPAKKVNIRHVSAN